MITRDLQKTATVLAVQLSDRAEVRKDYKWGLLNAIGNIEYRVYRVENADGEIQFNSSQESVGRRRRRRIRSIFTKRIYRQSEWIVRSIKDRLLQRCWSMN